MIAACVRGFGCRNEPGEPHDTAEPAFQRREHRPGFAVDQIAAGMGAVAFDLPAAVKLSQFWDQVELELSPAQVQVFESPEKLPDAVSGITPGDRVFDRLRVLAPPFGGPAEPVFIPECFSIQAAAAKPLSEALSVVGLLRCSAPSFCSRWAGGAVRPGCKRERFFVAPERQKRNNVIHKSPEALTEST